MREIKFRAWDGDRMQNVLTLGIYEGFVSTNKLHSDIEDFKLMQYTDLKDKNDKEIYEGDIVKGHWWRNGEKHRHIGRVTYVMNAFKVRGVKQYVGMDDALYPTYEIIGNIYENPELLEESK